MSTKSDPRADQRPTAAGLSELLRSKLIELSGNGKLSLRELGEARDGGRRALRIGGLPACRDTQFAIDAPVSVNMVQTTAKRTAAQDLSLPGEASVGADAGPTPAAPDDLATRMKPKGEKAVGEGERAEEVDGEGSYDEDTSDGMSGEGEITPMRVIARAKGIASSTSRDGHMTEMRLSALISMSAQFKSAEGVVLTPSHGDWWKPPDWQDVLGRSVQAEVIAAPVENPVDREETQYILEVEHDIWDCSNGIELTRRAMAKQVIGQSIGGWFTDVEILYNEDTGDLERIFILDVKLDHCAITRRPSNPDSLGLDILRTAADMAMRSVHAAEMQTRAAVAPPSVVAPVTVAPTVTEPSPAAQPIEGRDIPTTPPPPPAVATEERVALSSDAPTNPNQPSVNEQEQIAALDTPDSSRSVPQPNEDDMESPMTQTQIDQLILALRGAAPVPASAPAAPADKDAEIARLNAELDAARSQPQRRGLHGAGQPVAEPVATREVDLAGLNDRSDFEMIAETCIEARVMPEFATRAKAHARIVDMHNEARESITDNAVKSSCIRTLREAHRCGAFQAWANNEHRR
jgi:hypothetical protein